MKIGRVDSWVHEDADSRKEQPGVYTKINDAAEQRIDEEYAPQGSKCQHALWAILAAGGLGRRYAADRSKLLDLIEGKSVLERSFEILQKIPELQGTVVVCHSLWQKDYQNCLAHCKTDKPVFWVEGGASRRESVWHGLMTLPEETEIVLIHDAARPLVELERIGAAIEPVLNGQALGSSLGMFSANSLKKVAPGSMPWVEKTVERTHIWLVHTPQLFSKEDLVAAHKSIPKNLSINDDAELIELANPGKQAILMIPDSIFNIKITTAEDILLAEALLTKSYKVITTL